MTVCRWIAVANAHSDGISFSSRPFDRASLEASPEEAMEDAAPSLLALRPAEALAAARLLRVLVRAQLVPPPLSALEELLPLVPVATAVTMAQKTVQLMTENAPEPAQFTALESPAAAFSRAWPDLALAEASAILRAAITQHPAILGPLVPFLLASPRE